MSELSDGVDFVDKKVDEKNLFLLYIVGYAFTSCIYTSSTTYILT